jgi:hypothetical protein
VPLTVLALLGTVVAGCGGGGDPESGPSAAEVAEPREDIAAYADRLETALTSPDCEGLEKINDPELSGFPLPCPPRKAETKKAFAGFEVLGAASYGTGAVIDFTDGEAPDGAAYVLTLAEDRNWYIDTSPITEQLSVGTEIESKAGSAEVLDDFLDAIRDQDCEEFFRTSVTMSQDPQTACEEGLPLYDEVAAVLEASEGVEPVLLGGNRGFAFYGLTTDEPERAYRTAIVVKTAEGANEPYLVDRTSFGPLPE